MQHVSSLFFIEMVFHRNEQNLELILVFSVEVLNLAKDLVEQAGQMLWVQFVTLCRPLCAKFKDTIFLNRTVIIHSLITSYVKTFTDLSEAGQCFVYVRMMHFHKLMTLIPAI